MLSKGYGTGVFQFESPGMKDTLRRLKPDCIEDLIALGALYRPGPMDNIPTYIACKHKRQQPDYLHPLLKSILEPTYGVIIYQEQVLEISKVLAGYTLGAADLLRKAMGKKIKAEMEAQEEIFINGAKKNNIPEEQAKNIFATVAKFAGYGFNKAHASAYAVISYQTAYLKANFPAEFLTVCLNFELDNDDKINLFIEEAKLNNIKILPPDINRSRGYFTICNDPEKTIVYALGAIKNVTSNFGEIVADEVLTNGPFKSIINFMERMNPKLINRRLLENLIKAGSFDSLHSNRNQLFQSIQKLLAYSLSYFEEKHSNQFSLIQVNSSAKQVLIEAPILNKNQLAYDEFEVLGLFINNHPLADYQQIFEQLNIHNSFYLQNELPPGPSHIKIAGIIQKKDARMSARGRFITLQLSDPFGIFDLTIFSEEVLKDYVHLLNVKTPVIAHCDVFKDEGGVKITAKSFTKIEDALSQNKIDLKLYPKDSNQLKEIIHLLNNCTDIENNNANITILLSTESNFLAKINMPACFNIKSSDLMILKNFSIEKYDTRVES